MEQFEDKFQKFCVKISAKNCEDPFIDDEPILLHEFDHIDIHIEICNDDQFVRSENGKTISRRLRKIKDKLEKMRDKMIKRLTSPISPLKGTYWNDEK